jgi:hypothetical protein
MNRSLGKATGRAAKGTCTVAHSGFVKDLSFKATTCIRIDVLKEQRQDVGM